MTFTSNNTDFLLYLELTLQRLNEYTDMEHAEQQTVYNTEKRPGGAGQGGAGRGRAGGAGRETNSTPLRTKLASTNNNNNNNGNNNNNSNIIPIINLI